MKKLIYIAAAALVLSACVKDAELPVKGNVEKITFEAEASVQTKTTLVDGTKVFWCSGDQISVMGAEEPFTNALAEGETAAKTAFTGEVATADTYYAVYPAVGVKWNGTVATTTAAMRQNAVSGSFDNGLNITVANTTSQEKSFSFSNVLGYVKVPVTSSDIKSVIITANGGEKLSGGVTVDCAAENPAAEAVSGSNVVTLNSSGALASGDYYVALIPGTYSEGLTFEFVNTDNMIASKSISTSIELKAGNINTITTSGLSWTDPAGDSENVIWKGKYVTGSWDHGMMDLAYGGYNWSNVKAGDILKIHGGAADTTKTPTIGLRNGKWVKVAGLNDYYNNPAEVFTVTLTEEMVADLSANSGLVIQGDHYYFTLVELIPGTGEEEDPGEDESESTVLWEGEFLISGWNGMQELAWGGFDWSKCEPGNVLKITGEAPSVDWWCISLRVGTDWTHLNGVPVQYDKPGIVYIELTQEIIDDLVARNGLVIQGEGGYKLTRVELYEDMPNEIVVWEGSFECGTSYAGLSISPGEIPYGSTLNVGYETPDGVGDGYYQIKLLYVDSNWGWNDMSSTASDVNEYGYVTLSTSATEYSVKLTDSDVDAINAGKGIVVQGYAAVITKVSYTVE